MPVNLGPLKDDSYWISSTEKAYDSPYYKPGYEYVDSPYYANPFYRRIEKVHWDEPKQELWQCKYCGSTNKDDVIKCESCNAPRHIKKEVEQASVWGMNLLDVIPKGESWYPEEAHFQTKFKELEKETTRFKVAFGEMLVEPFLKFTERISRLWNGLKSVS